MLLTQGLHHETVTNRLAHLKAIFNQALEDDKIKANPAASVKVKKPSVAEPGRQPFDLEDLKTIFASPYYAEHLRPRGGGGEAIAWLPLLALFTGAREEELGQLLVDDVRHDPVAGDYLEITDLGEGDKSVKTVASRRRVPIHPKLIKAGFIKYRTAMAKAGHVRLFPDLNPDRFGHVTGNWSKAFSRYLREIIGIKDPRKVFYSFRHTFKDACREAGISEDIHDALTGHSNSSVSRGYGKGHSLATLTKALQQIQYPGVTIPTIPIPSVTKAAAKPRKPSAGRTTSVRS